MKKLFLFAALALLPLFAKTQNLCPDSRHPHWIDLGLPSGTKWACCNEGASAPEEYGVYHRYNYSLPPKLYQIKELLNHTTSVWTTKNGVNGRKFTGPNGKSIFLPAAGGIVYGQSLDVGSLGSYWSSTLDDEANFVYLLDFSSDRSRWVISDFSRHRFPVRSAR